MADFQIAHRETMGNEGGYANNPNDRGGETYKGIARHYHPRWQGWPILDRVKTGIVNQPKYGTSEYFAWAKHLNKALAVDPMIQKYVLAFYKAEFWDRSHLSEFPSQGLANLIYDLNVNTGSRGTRWLQQALGVEDDGCVGPATLAVVRAANGDSLVEIVKDKAEAHYKAEAAKPGQAGFLGGWLARIGRGDTAV